jgi:hypothetical protein
MRPLIEGEDFYYDEAGWIVFTEKFHLDRGHCCGNGCRHCPYGHSAVPEVLRKKPGRDPEDPLPEMHAE